MNGDINYNDNHTAFNATASVSCKDGFEIQGDNFVTCQADGTWSQASCVKSMYKCSVLVILVYLHLYCCPDY